MPEIEPEELDIDRSLRSALAGPPPALSPDFDHRLMAEVGCRNDPLGRFGRGLLAGYGALSLATSATVMRGEGLDWAWIGALALGPLALTILVAVVGRAVRRSPPAARRNRRLG